MRLIVTVLLVLMVGRPGFGQNPNRRAPESPPSIISTSPQFWEKGVDPSAQKRVTLTFDQVMSPAYTAWLGESSIAPELNLSTSMSSDRRTMEVKVHLQQGKVYVFALNERRIPGVGFQNLFGMSAPASYLVFQTAGQVKAADAPPEVAKTLPANNVFDVEASATKAFVVDFNREMNSSAHGFHLFEDDQSVDLTKASFGYSADGKRFSIVYNFQPGKSYRVEMNSTQDIGFRSNSGAPLWPLTLRFATAATPAN